MRLTKSDIFRLIDDSAYFERGESYFSKRKVLMCHWQADDRVIGRVSGSSREVYSIDARLIVDCDGRVSEVVGDCSCPIGYNCKHVAALLLDAAQTIVTPASDRKAEAPKNGGTETQLPGAVSTWLDRIGNANPRPERAVSGGASQHQIFFVFARNDCGGAAITPFKTYVKKDRSIGKSIQEYRNYGRMGYQDGSVTVEDTIILAQIGYFPADFTRPAIIGRRARRSATCYA